MKKLLLLPIIVLLSLISISFVSATTGNFVNNNYTYIYQDYATATYNPDGLVVKPKFNISVYNVTSGSTAVNVTIRSPALTGSVVGFSNNKSGNVFIFNPPVNLTYGQNYSFTSVGTFYRNISANTLPVQSPHLNFTQRIDNGILASGNYLHNFNQIITCLQNETCVNPIVPNVTITSTDAFDSSSITNFSVEIGGTNYSTTTGTITTNVLSNATSLYNVTFFNALNNQGYYFNKTLTNQNVSSGSITTTLSQTDIKILGYEKITSNERTGSFWTSGGLKTYNTSIGFKAGSYNVTWLNASYSSVYNKTQEFTFTALQNATVNISGIYNQVLNFTAKTIAGSNINNFTINVNDTIYDFTETQSTTNGTMSFFVIKSLNYTAFINNTLYAITNSTNYDYINTTANQYNKSFSLYESQSVYLTFKDQATGTTINWSTITFEAIGSYNSYNYTTTNGTLYASFLTPDSYTARYRGTGYTERFYYFTVSSQSTQNLTLYLVNSSTAGNVTITVLDENGAVVENALVKALKYDLATNTYILQESSLTNIEGSTIQTLTLYNEFYKFIIEYPVGDTKLTTSPSYITSNSLLLQIFVNSPVGDSYFNFLDLDYTASFNEITDNFRLDYNDVSGISNNICLYAYNSSLTIVNSSCSTSSSGTLLVGVTNVSGATYYGKVYYLDDDGDYQFVTSISYTFAEQSLANYSVVYFFVILLVVVVMFSLVSLPLALISVPVLMIFATLMGIINIPIWVSSIVLVLGMIVITSLGDKA